MHVNLSFFLSLSHSVENETVQFIVTVKPERAISFLNIINKFKSDHTGNFTIGELPSLYGQKSDFIYKILIFGSDALA